MSIYPQGYAAIAPYASKLTGVNVIADIGNGTMNVLYMVNGKPKSGKMFTEKFGTYQCTLAVREAFMQQTQRELNDHIIEEVLRTGKADIPKSDLAIVKAVAAEYVNGIFRRLREHGYDENTMRLWVTGGGGCLIKILARSIQRGSPLKMIFAPQLKAMNTLPMFSFRQGLD